MEMGREMAIMPIIPFLRILVLIILLSVYSSCCIAKEVDQVCSNTQNVTFCQEYFRLDPISDYVGLEVLGMIAINLAIDHVGELRPELNRLSQRTSDPDLKLRYQMCMEYANDAIDYDLAQARYFFSKKDYSNMYNYASKIQDNALRCDLQFENSPPDEPDELIHVTINVKQVATILAAIATLSGR